MTLRSLSSALLLLAVALPERPAQAAKSDKARVAVLSTTTKRASDRDLGAIVSELLLEQMTKVPAAEAFGEADALGMLGEGARKQLAACNDDSACMIEIGGALGVEYLLSSSFGSIGSNYLLVVRLLNTGDGSITARVSETVPRDEDKLAAAICPMMQRLLTDASAKASKLAPPVNLCGAPPVVAEQKPVEVKPAEVKPVAPSEPPKPVAEVVAPPAQKEEPKPQPVVEVIKAPPEGGTVILPAPPTRPSFAVRAGMGGHLGVLGVGAEWRPSWFGLALGTGSHLLSGGVTFGSSANEGGLYVDLHATLVRPGLVTAMLPDTSGVGVGASVGYDLRPVPFLSVKAGLGVAYNSLGGGPLTFDLNAGPVF